MQDQSNQLRLRAIRGS